LLPAGMTAATIIEPVTIRYTSLDHWWRSAWAQEPAIAWSHIPASQRDQARQAAFAVLAGLQGPGSWLEHTRTFCYTTAPRATPSPATQTRQLTTTAGRPAQ